MAARGQIATSSLRRLASRPEIAGHVCAQTVDTSAWRLKPLAWVVDPTTARRVSNIAYGAADVAGLSGKDGIRRLARRPVEIDVA